MNNNSIFSSAIFFTVTSIGARIVGFLVQIILGWFLTKEHFGVYSIALSIAGVISCLRNGGTDQLLIQKGRSAYRTLAPQIGTFSIIFNVFACALVFSISGFLEDYYKMEMLSVLLNILIIGSLLASPGPVLVARLSILHRYRQIALVSLISILLKHGFTIILAIIGIGVYSLVIPLAFQPLLAAIISYYYVGFLPKLSTLKSIQFKAIFNESKWVIASSLVYQLALNIQYFILAIYFSISSIGIYFFAVQLLNSPISLIDATFKSVLFPKLTSLYDSSEIYRIAVRRSVFVSFLIGSIIGLMGYVILPYVTNFIWQGKWNESVRFIQMMCLMTPFIILFNSLYEVMASAGVWRFRFVTLFIITVVEMLTIYFAVKNNDLYHVIAILLLVRIISVTSIALYMFEHLEIRGSIKNFIIYLLPYITICVLIVFLELCDLYGEYSKIFYFLCVVISFYNYHLLNVEINISNKIRSLFVRRIPNA